MDVGLSFLEAVVTGDFAVTAFDALNGTLNAGSADSIYMAILGCPDPPFLLGRWTLQNVDAVVSGRVCLRSPSGYGAPPGASCVASWCSQLPVIDIAGVTGFSVGGVMSCRNAHGCVSRRAVPGVEGP
jgi:hypothetical protein